MGDSRGIGTRLGDTVKGGAKGAALGYGVGGPPGAIVGGIAGAADSFFGTGILPTSSVTKPGGPGGGDAALLEAFQKASDRYAAFRPEDMARRKQALQQAMSMMDPTRRMLSAMGGGAPMIDPNAFFAPPGSPAGAPPPSGPRTDPTLNRRGTPSGAAPPPGPPPPDIWRGGPA